MKVFPHVFNEKEKRDINHEKRCAFYEGYKAAEKDTLERVLNWIDDHSGNYLSLSKTEEYVSANFYTHKLIEDCRKAMEKTEEDDGQ